MFELVSGGARHPFHDRTIVPTLVSVVGHGFVVTAVVMLPLLYATNHLPEVPAMMAFVATATPPPPPPPPPPSATRAAQPKAAPVPATGKQAAPLEAPPEIAPEPAMLVAEAVHGVEGGVVGWIAGGVVGGIVGGLTAALPPPPPPPPPSPPPAPPPQPHPTPVRIGGQLAVPALVYRVDPTYPHIAVLAKVTGVVVLEALVGEDGCVESVRVLRSLPILDQAAIDAVKQWRYSPLVLNGVPTPFVLSVTLSFRVKQ